MMEANLDLGPRISSDKFQERDVAIVAQSEYEKGNHAQTLSLLESLDNHDSKAVTHNRLIAQFGVDQNVDQLMNGLITSEDLDLDQQVLIDYNRALALAKYRDRYDEAIELLENRMSVLSQSISLVDDRLTIKVYLLLAVLYMERRKDPTKALPLLQFIDKCDATCHPPRIQQLKAKCFLQMGSFKNAKRELKAMSGEPLIRSYLELQRSNYKKALKIFSSCTEDSPIHRNNDGLIQYGLGKKNTAVFCVAKAVEKNNSPEMLYNLAVLHLFTGNTKNAFDILYSLIHHFKNNPRIWFRLAECCLEERARHQEVESNKNKHDVIKGLNCDGGFLSKESSNQESLSFARGCLLNSLSVLNSNDCNFYPSNNPLENDLDRFKIGIFLSLSYTSLCLNDFSPAYTFAKTALSLHPKSFQKVLAHLYAGESLIRMDRVDAALEHFVPSIVEEPPPVEEGSTTPPPAPCSWFPNSAKVVVAFNQAVSYTIRGDLDRAAETIRLISSNISPSDNLVPVQVIMLATYIQLKQGYIDAAKSLIRQHLTQLR